MKAPGILQAFVGVLTKPADFYASVRDAGGFGGPVVFALVAGVVAGVVTAVYAVLGFTAVGGAAGGAFGAMAGTAAVIGYPIFAVIGCFVGGAVVHVISLVAGGKGSYEQSVRVAGYAGAVMPIGALLAFVPLLGSLPSLYGLYLCAVGLVVIHAADRKRAYAVMGVLGALVLLFAILGMFAGRAAQRMSSDLNAKFGPGSELQQNVQQEMQRAMEELKRRQAEEQRRQAAPPPAQPAQEPQK